jgi:hypothetical protein
MGAIADNIVISTSCIVRLQIAIYEVILPAQIGL